MDGTRRIELALCLVQPCTALIFKDIAVPISCSGLGLCATEQGIASRQTAVKVGEASDEPWPSELVEKRTHGPASGEGHEHVSLQKAACRLSQASILCMRELFRTVVNDGDISEELD